MDDEVDNAQSGSGGNVGLPYLYETERYSAKISSSLTERIWYFPFTYRNLSSKSYH